MKFYRRRRVSPVITIVSLVDILTMVLMFFVYTTTFKTQNQEVQINLPKAVSGENVASKTKPALLAIKPNGDMFIDDKPIQLDQLPESVKTLQDQGRSIAMKADKDASFGRIMEVLDTLKQAKVENIPALTSGK